MGYHFSSRLTATLNLCSIYFKITWALSTLLEHMHKKFEINWTKIKGSCQWGRKVVTHDFKSDLPLGLCKSSFVCNRKPAFGLPAGSLHPLWKEINEEGSDYCTAAGRKIQNNYSHCPFSISKHLPNTLNFLLGKLDRFLG